MLHARMIVSGKVQGVFFRNKTKQYADKLGIRGFVKNNDDGTVETVAEGDQDFVEKFIEWVKKGPETAEVQGVEISRKSIPNPTFTTFKIE